ncbi:hypothetical protein FRC00_004342 [Tulasnella sp. 408]|nr:hypothetical protein FRC00_004342 [Tulasnella sp. 408]
MVEAWIAVWATEDRGQPKIASTSPSAPAHDAAVTDGVLPGQSQASSIVTATPSVTEEHQGMGCSAEADQQDARGLPPIAEENEGEHAEPPSGEGESNGYSGAARSEDQMAGSSEPPAPKPSSSKKPKAAVSKAKALAKSSEPSGSLRKLTKRQQAVEAAAKKVQSNQLSLGVHRDMAKPD